MFSKAFARDLTERVISTFAQALVAVLIAANSGLLETDWVTVLSLAGMTALISLLKGFAAYGLGDNETGASLLPNPPPKVEGGHVDLATALLVGVLIGVVALVLVATGHL